MITGKRWIQLERAEAADGSKAISMLASTDKAIDWGGWREVLVHKPDNIDWGACRALLVNHDRDMIAGVVTSNVVREGKLYSEAEIDASAKLPTDMTVQRAVEIGALKGVSISYGYTEDDVTWDDSTRTCTVNKWRLLEISLVSTPADPEAAVRALPDGINKDRAMADQPATTQTAGAVAASPTIDPIVVARHAEGLGLRASDYLGKADWQDAMLADAAKARATAAPVRTQVVAEEKDKVRAAALENILGGRALKAAHIVARSEGVDVLDKGDLVKFVFDGFRSASTDGLIQVERGLDGQLKLKERAALVTSSFAQAAGLAASKFMVDGFLAYKPWSDEVVNKRAVSDFKTVRAAGLQGGDFSSPAEGSAFSDLTIAEAGGSGNLTMRGAGVELTKQLIYNDELGLFFDFIRRTGYLGAQHQDKLIATTIEGATYTAATAALALSAANLKTAWTNFVGVTGPSGEKPGYMPKIILAPSALAITALELTTLAQGSATANPLAANDANAKKMPLKVVHGLHLSDANDWYLMADPMEAAGFTFITHTDYPVPQLFEVDAGLVASRKFRVEYPTGVITSHLNPGTNTKPVGAYRCTQP